MNESLNPARRRIVCFGGANMDLHIQSTVPVILHDSNPGKIHTSPGGVMRNIAENCARLGAAPVLLSAVGKDAFGDRIQKDSEAAGIDMSRVYLHPDCPTSCYMAFMDRTGDMLVAANDMRIMDLLPEDYLTSQKDVLQSAAVILCDANPPLERIRQLVDLAGDVPIFADPVSVAKGSKFLEVLDRIWLFKPNLIELQHLSGLPCGTEEEIRTAAASLLLIMPLSGSMAAGLGAAVIGYCLLHGVAGEGKQIPIASWLLAAMFVLYFVYAAL